MKKVLQILIITGFSIIGLTQSVQAAQSCVIENTGAESANVCTNIEEVACTVVNENTITINNTNYQVSDSGDATVVGNTNGGGSGSGSSSNSTSTAINIVVNNQDEVEGQLCTVTTTTTTPVEESQTPVAGGAGAAMPTVLPKTSVSPLSVIGTVLAIGVVLALVSRLVLAVAHRN